MNRKLTLSLDDIIIEKAKIFAHDNKESLSHLVENYFKFITTEIKDETKISPLVHELMGSIKAPKDFNYNQVRSDYLEEKYL